MNEVTLPRQHVSALRSLENLRIITRRVFCISRFNSDPLERHRICQFYYRALFKSPSGAPPSWRESKGYGPVGGREISLFPLAYKLQSRRLGPLVHQQIFFRIHRGNLARKLRQRVAAVANGL